MAYSREIRNIAAERIAENRRDAEMVADYNRARFFSKYPEARELSNKKGQTFAKIGIAMARGKDVRENLKKVKEENLALQAKIEEILKEAGMTKADITPQYSCQKCNDTGYDSSGNRCECFKQMCKIVSYEEFNKKSMLKNASFDTFDYKRYIGINNGMLKNLEDCKKFAYEFKPGANGIIMIGPTGLGKTHLSTAIGRVVIEKGYSVVSESAFRLVNQIESERFSDERDKTIALLSEADLLIIDDLGAENLTNYTLAALTNIIDTRIANEKSTIISTNRDVKELEKTYSERIVSRIFGYYRQMRFSGLDNRVNEAKNSLQSGR